MFFIVAKELMKPNMLMSSLAKTKSTEPLGSV